MSGLGKGITAASTGRILKNKGYNVTAIKIDPYINIDAGTMSPFQHGEVYVLKDGGEADLDLGNYERFMDINLTSPHNITTGKIYKTVIEKERRGDYLGKTVQIIPHITNEIKERIRKVAKDSGAEICLVEVGGTVGDIESMPFLEAVRQMRAEEKEEDFTLIHVTLVPIDTMGDMKTKPTQHSVKELRELGVKPDIIVGRCKKPLDQSTKAKISMFCDVPEAAIISAHDADDIYKVPLQMEKEGLADCLMKRMGLAVREDNQSWAKMVQRMEAADKTVTVAIVSKYGIEDVYLSVKEALKHAGIASDCKVNIKWVESEDVEAASDLKPFFGDVDGILVPGGFGNRGIEGNIKAIQYAREHDLPYLGLCFGFQLAVIEFTRHVAGFPDATSSELSPDRHPRDRPAARAEGSQEARWHDAAGRTHGVDQGQHDGPPSVRQGQDQRAAQAPLRGQPRHDRDDRATRDGLLRQERQPHGDVRDTEAPVLPGHPVPPGVQVPARAAGPALPRVRAGDAEEVSRCDSGALVCEAGDEACP